MWEYEKGNEEICMERHVQVLILGAGCAGLTAGIYAARAGKQVLILEHALPGGQAALTAEIDNYPGLPGIDGVTLMQQMEQQARSCGAELLCTGVRSVDPASKTVETDRGSVTGDALILATGAVPRELGIPGEAEFRGRGVSYCAACDGFFYRGKDIYVVGGGNSAAEEALHLAELGSRVRLLVRKNALKCDQAIRERLLRHQKIEVYYHRELAEIRGEERVETLLLRDSETGELTQVPAAGCGVFIFIGYRPAAALFAGKLEMDENGYLLTDEQLQTSVPGVFAAGDVRRKELRQIVTAVSDGAIAGAQACKFLSDVV
ncbi:MAG: FAD-dependent oxidoreductase [bacterium]|nr:FAD-dependent oxidoreductase [bacterium]